MHELRRRPQLSIGPDRPVTVVKVKLRRHVGEVDVGFPVGVYGSDITPIWRRLMTGAHAGFGEAVGDGLTVLDDVGDDVLAEVSARPRFGRVAAELLHQELRLGD